MAGGNSGTEPSGLIELGPFSTSPELDVPSEGEAYGFRPYPSRRKVETGPDDRKIFGLGHRVRILQEIDTALNSITKAKESDEPMVRATEAYYLEDCLKVLWEMRVPRENEFKELVNILRLHLMRITLENITDQQLDAYASILDTILRRTVREGDFQKALDILEANDIEPWSLLASND